MQQNFMSAAAAQLAHIGLEYEADDYLKELERREERKAQYAAQGAWVKYVLCVPVFFRAQAFAEIQHNMSDSLYWRLLGCLLNRGSARVITLPYEHAAVWYALLTAARPEREAYTRPLDRERWRSLPERITVYRGYGQENPGGVYMTLNRYVAEWIASRPHHNGQGRVQELRINKHDCMFYGGKQDSLIYLPRLRTIADVQAIQ